jgi:hypothetical protein
MSDRRRRKTALTAGLPGLAVFDAAPLVINYEGSVRRIRVSLKGRQYLHLNGLTLRADQPVDLEQAAAVMSSVLDDKSAEPLDLLRNLPIHTRKDRGPFWEAVFTSPILIQGVEIRNRQGKRAGRASGILVEFEDATGQVTVFDNLSQDTIGARVAEARQAGEQLLAVAHGTEQAEAFARIWNALLDQTQNAAASGAATPEALSLAREEAIDAMLQLLHALEGADLQRAIHIAAGMTAMLLPRGTPKRISAKPIETRAFAVHVVNMLLQRRVKKIQNLEFNGFRGLYNREELIAVLEEEMAALYLRATGDADSLPFMVRVHGISGPVLQPRADDYLSAMQDLQEALERIGYGCMICYGTLLGAVREGKFIEHDDDVDMAVVLRTPDALPEMQELAALLKSHGLRG